jgi:UDP-N-acetylmuramoylalanine--D-glutamate ligase
MAASLAALISGCNPDNIRKILEKFPGLEHRLEFVKEINGVTFINDSKGTNIGAVAKSLESFENIILIMGGIYKGGDFSTLKDLVKRRVKFLILLGEAKEKIEKALRGTTEILKVNDLDEAVKTSISVATKGDVVLLSPGCASFDMFRDFEERGKKFKEIIKTIQDSK